MPRPAGQNPTHVVLFMKKKCHPHPDVLAACICPSLIVILLLCGIILATEILPVHSCALPLGDTEGVFFLEDEEETSN